jgi:hypothetical protein
MTNDFYDEFESVFIDNDKPEFVPGVDEGCCPCPPPKPAPNPKEYYRKPNVINRPYSNQPTPGPYRPDYTTEISDNNIPNPVPNTYFVPGHHRHCPPPPPPK